MWRSMRRQVVAVFPRRGASGAADGGSGGGGGGVELEYRCLSHAAYLEVMTLPGDSPPYIYKKNNLLRYTRIIWFLRAEGREREGTGKRAAGGGGGRMRGQDAKEHGRGEGGGGGDRFMWSILIQADF